MPPFMRDFRLPARYHVWKWWVCGLLLLATMINYMDRLTLNLLSSRIMDSLQFDVLGYGRIESAFAIAFALGAIGMGFAVDRFGAFWVYPFAVLAWSLAGFCTGFAWGFESMLACRFMLGLAESGNWPCALRTTQTLLPPEERTMGNSILQSGTALGSVITPGIIYVLVKRWDSWQAPFWVVGAFGLSWVVLWFVSVRPRSLALNRAPAGDDAPVTRPSEVKRPPLPLSLFIRRFACLVIVVIAINAAWHFYRAWLPLFLQKEHGYTEDETMGFASLYYIAADLGSLSAGVATLLIVRRGVPVHRGRVLVYLGFAVLTALSVVAAFVPGGPWLPVVLLVVAFGALGVFPNYYSFSQELTVRHQGKLTGFLGCSCWLAMALLHEVVGNWVKAYGSYRLAVGVAGLMPLVGFLALVLLWGKTPATTVEPERDEAYPLPPAVTSETGIQADSPREVGGDLSVRAKG
jgi:ACS family hexuronate transporter-like MFS transporter